RDRAERAREPGSVQPPHERARCDEAAVGDAKTVQERADAVERAILESDGIRARRCGDIDADRIHVMCLPTLNAEHAEFAESSFLDRSLRAQRALRLPQFRGSPGARELRLRM